MSDLVAQPVLEPAPAAAHGQSVECPDSTLDIRNGDAFAFRRPRLRQSGSDYRGFFLPREVRWSWQTFGVHSDDLELFLLEHCVPIQATGCWEWTGSRTQANYGFFSWGRRNWYAHRVSQILWNGPLTPELPYALHGCDNPPCIAPDHLRAGTAKDNVNDRDARGRSNYLQASFLEASKWCDDSLRAVFSMRAAGATQPEIARSPNTTQQQVSDVLLGKVFAHRTAHLRAARSA